jgi:hypothetical protein
MLLLRTALLTIIMILIYPVTSYSSVNLTYATTIGDAGTIPLAEVVHSSELMKVPPSVGTFVILIPNEAHENWSDEKHKLITDKNSYYVPTNLIIPNGTAIVFLHADAPWDTPNPHTIELQDSSGNAVYSTGQLDYTFSSKPIVLPSPGTYNIVDKSYDTKESKITVLNNETSIGNSIV